MNAFREGSTPATVKCKTCPPKDIKNGLKSMKQHVITEFHKAHLLSSISFTEDDRTTGAQNNTDVIDIDMAPGPLRNVRFDLPNDDLFRGEASQPVDGYPSCPLPMFGDGRKDKTTLVEGFEADIPPVTAKGVPKESDPYWPYPDK